MQKLHFISFNVLVKCDLDIKRFSFHESHTFHQHPLLFLFRFAGIDVQR